MTLSDVMAIVGLGGIAATAIVVLADIVLVASLAYMAYRLVAMLLGWLNFASIDLGFMKLGRSSPNSNERVVYVESRGRGGSLSHRSGGAGRSRGGRGR